MSRVTKRPGRAPNGVRIAERILSEAEVREGLRLDDDALAALKACCTLRPPRNAASIVNGIRTRLEYSQPKPKQVIGHEGSLVINVICDVKPKDFD